MLNNVKPETLALLNLAKPDSKNLDARNIDEMLGKSIHFYFILYAYLLGGFTFEGLKFDDLTPICQIHQVSTHQSFWFYGM